MYAYCNFKQKFLLKYSICLKKVKRYSWSNGEQKIRIGASLSRANCMWAQLPLGEFTWGEFPWAQFTWGELHVGRIARGANSLGASYTGANYSGRIARGANSLGASYTGSNYSGRKAKNELNQIPSNCSNISFHKS